MKTNKKNLGRLVLIVLALLFSCCADRSSVYTLELPPTPQAWVSILGEPCWRVEWLSPEGRKQSADITPGGSLQVELPSTWASPVTARPYWPGLNLYAGLFMPVGALFPFDVSKDRLRMSWEAGLDADFFWELAYAGNSNNSKNPANFDWQRFRDLFTSGVLDAAVVKDPWLVDWRSVAEKTVNGNFVRRNLVPQSTSSMNIPVPGGPWYGTSPFAEPLYFEEEEPSFPIRPGLNVWISREGLLRVDGMVWIFKEY